MKTTNGTDCRPCDNGLLEHPRFFPRQMITAADLTQEQGYWRDRLRRHNRYLHGWGVVCGAQVEPVIGKDGNAVPWKVRITPGYILGPYGDEILIDCPREVDLETRGVACSTGDPAGDPVDPWCTPAKVNRKQDVPLYIAVSYCEFRTRPVRIQPNGCGCDDGQCENSRLHDGYQIHVLTDAPCPPSDGDGKWPSINDLIPQLGKPFDLQPLLECPPCPKEPWVVLAKVTPGARGVVEGSKIDNCFCRRNVVSLAHAWWTCETKEKVTCALTLTRDGKEIKEGEPIAVVMNHPTDLLVSGPPLADLATIKGATVQLAFSSGDNVGTQDTVLTPVVKSITDAGILFTVRVPSGAAAGNRTLVVTTPDGIRCELHDVITLPAG